MNNAIIPLLHSLLKEQSALHGKALLSDLTLLRNLLADYAPQYRAERNLLLRAIEENIPAEIITQSKNGEMVDPLLIGRWVRHLESNHGMSPENARWAVMVWIKALGRNMTPDSLRSSLLIRGEVVSSVSPPVRSLSVEQKRLLSIMLDVNHSPQERAKIGRRINNIPGRDPRPGVLDLNWDEEYWCLVLRGEFQMGSEKDDDNPRRFETIDYDFWIARYPITYGQWKLFLEAKNGYRNPEWWKDLHPGGKAQQREGAGKQDFKYDNHPAQRVSWYDAVAFCRWLNAFTSRPLLPPAARAAGVKYQIRLPLETEWEKAASWDAKAKQAHEYPWGDGYQAGFANIMETAGKIGPHYLQTPTAVGIYPQGASPCGALDMSGNVWEWCLNEYFSGKVNISSSEIRSLRGGSWGSNQGGARSAYRNDSHSYARGTRYGFRVVWAPVSL